MAGRLFASLGLTATTTVPEQTILHDLAISQVTPLPDATPALLLSLPRALGPAGLIVSNATDVLRFVALHLDHGTTVDGTRLPSPDPAAVSAEPIRSAVFMPRAVRSESYEPPTRPST